MRNHAPFIWTADQPVDPMGMFGGLLPCAPREEKTNRWFLFRRKVNLASPARSAPLHVTVDGRYELFVNGTRVGRGPARCSPLYQRYDSYDIAEHLQPGENVIALLIRVFGEDMSWYEQVRGLWQPVFGDGGLWLFSSIETADSSQPLKSDLDWRCLESDAWQQDTPRPSHGLGWIEVLDARALPEGWTKADFDDRAWGEVREMVAGGGGPEAAFGGMEARPFPTLLPNTMAPLAEDVISPSRIVWIKKAHPNHDAPLHEQVYSDELSDASSGMVENADALLRDDDTVATIRTSGTHDVSLLLDFGHITTIHPLIEMDATGGEVVDIAVSERLPDEWDAGGPTVDSRIQCIPTPLGLDAHLSRYTARPGQQCFERFEWQAAKWMQITVRNAQEGLKLRLVGGRFTRYPAEWRGYFTCSDPMLTDLWNIGRHTLQLCMHDGWEDCPSREQRQWLGDATVENLVGHACFGPSIAPLNAEFLRKCAESQRPDGLTQMFAPGNHGVNSILIPDWTLQWVLNARDHLRLAGDMAVIEEIFPSIQKALAWFERMIGSNGLIADIPYWQFMDWAGFGRTGEACALNAQLSGSFLAAAEIAESIDIPRVASRYRGQAKAIQHALNARHWDHTRGVYVDCVDPATGTQGKRVSQHANAAMILWGEAPQDRWPAMIERITDQKRITFTAAPPIVPTGEVLDEDEGVVLANTFYSHFVFEALAKAGRLDLAMETIRKRYGQMLARGATTLWESFDPTGSLCHAFSASPSWILSAHVLGVQRRNNEGLVLAPNLIDLDHASGTFPLREGNIDVELKRTGDGFDAHYDIPEGLETDVVPPAGFTVVEKILQKDVRRRRFSFVRNQ